MTVRSTIRRHLCTLLVLPLCAPILATAQRCGDCNSAISLRALSTHPASILTLVERHARARQHPSATSPFTLGSHDGPASDRGRFAAAGEPAVRPSLRAAGPRTGRSPPVS